MLGAAYNVPLKVVNIDEAIDAVEDEDEDDPRLLLVGLEFVAGLRVVADAEAAWRRMVRSEREKFDQRHCWLFFRRVEGSWAPRSIFGRSVPQSGLRERLGWGDGRRR